MRVGISGNSKQSWFETEDIQTYRASNDDRIRSEAIMRLRHQAGQRLRLRIRSPVLQDCIEDMVSDTIADNLGAIGNNTVSIPEVVAGLMKTIDRLSKRLLRLRARDGGELKVERLATDSNPEEAIIARDFLERVIWFLNEHMFRALSSLPDEYYERILSYYGLDRFGFWSRKPVAEKSKSPEAARKALFRARQQFRELLLRSLDDRPSINTELNKAARQIILSERIVKVLELAEEESLA